VKEPAQVNRVLSLVDGKRVNVVYDFHLFPYVSGCANHSIDRKASSDQSAVLQKQHRRRTGVDGEATPATVTDNAILVRRWYSSRRGVAPQPKTMVTLASALEVSKLSVAMRETGRRLRTSVTGPSGESIPRPLYLGLPLIIVCSGTQCPIDRQEVVARNQHGDFGCSLTGDAKARYCCRKPAILKECTWRTGAGMFLLSKRLTTD
jgi:hypothetical protein